MSANRAAGRARSAARILRLTDKTDGEVKFNGIDLYKLPPQELRRLRPKMQLIFQDPYSSLNPRMRIGDAIGEALLDHGLASREEVRDRVDGSARRLRIVGRITSTGFRMNSPAGSASAIGIARALVLNPELIIADEPVSALDVSIQAQIINLFRKLAGDARTDVFVHLP